MMKLNRSTINANIEDSLERTKEFIREHVHLFSHQGTIDKITLTYRGKMVLIVVGLIIGLSSLTFTNHLARQLREKEQNEVHLWSYAMSRLGDVNNQDPLIQLIIHANNKIPFILIDQNLSVINYHLIPSDIIENKEKLMNQLEMMSAKNPRIEIPSYVNTFYLFYDESAILKSIYYYPYIQIGVILIFLLFTYFTFKFSKRDEQNRVWIGMAKETAHQLGTPTSSLLGWLEYLKTQPVDPMVTDEMNMDLIRLLKVIDRFSKIGSSTTLSEKDVCPIVENCINYFNTRMPKNVALNFNKPQFPIVCMINDALFEWVIENVIKNAIDALQGKGEITVSMLQDDRHLHIDITDTGKGIPKSSFKRIFEPGYTTKTRGWGLGLSLSKRIIRDNHHGRIFVLRSEINHGTTMRIELKKV
jgi:hypothetical protein